MAAIRHGVAALALVAALMPTEAAVGNVAEELSKNSRTSFFYQAVNVANLASQLGEIGPFTIFAPVNEAFDALGPNVAQSLLRSENLEYLLTLLQYHIAYAVTASHHMYVDLIIRSSEGSVVTVTSLSPLRVNEIVKITSPDVSASNGLLHVTDTVLIPPGFQFPAPTMNLVQLAKQADNLHIFVQAVRAAGMEEQLSTDMGPDAGYTVYAPTDAAFRAMGLGVADSLLLHANKLKLNRLLSYHILHGKKHSSNFQEGEGFRSLEGGVLTVSQIVPLLKINTNIYVTAKDVSATNGMINVIDTVMPPSDFFYPTLSTLDFLRRSPDLSILAAAFEAAELEEILTNQLQGTLLAPTDGSFERLGTGFASSLLLPSSKERLQGLLKFHLLASTKRSTDVDDGDMVRTEGRGTLTIRGRSPLVFNEARATTQDVPTTNGVVHILDRVLFPKGFEFPDKDVVRLAATEDDLSMFRKAISLSGMEETLTSSGPYTVFAPSNSAFEALGEYALERLLVEGNPTLTHLVQYHVVPSKLEDNAFTYACNIPTLQGGVIQVTPWTDHGWRGIAHEAFMHPATLNEDTKLTKANVLVTNGFIHFVDKVLLPPGFEVPVSTTNWRQSLASGGSRHWRLAAVLWTYGIYVLLGFVSGDLLG